MPLWLYIDFPYLQLDTLFSDQSNQPLVVVEGKGAMITQANQAAFEQGIALGMGIGSASAMCAHLQVHPYQQDVEEQRLRDVAQWLYLITSDIVLFPPRGILLRVSNMLSLYQGFEHYWQCVSQHLEPWGLRYQFSTGFSPLSAMLLAKSETNSLSTNKTELTTLLNAFPITSTELDEKQIEALRRIGVTKLSELFALPMSELARRFNIDLVNYVGRLQGQFKHPLNFFYPPETFITELELLFDVENVQWLTKPLTILLKRLEPFLRMRNQVAYELALHLSQRSHLYGNVDGHVNKDGTEIPQHQSVTFTSATGEYRADCWLKLAQLTLESLKLNAAVHHIQLTVVRAGEQASHANDLFSGIQGALPPLELISLLQAKLGKEAVCKVVMGDDPRPEKTSHYIDATQPAPSPHRPALLRPSLLLPHPQPLTEQVNVIHGPERIATGWWDGHPITRDYYIAHSQQGRWLWIFRDQQKRWFLHGQFS
jgi:protein ImuB